MNPVTPNSILRPVIMRQASDLRQQLQTASQELTSGNYADVTSAVRGDYSHLAATDHSLARLSGYAATGAELSLMASAMQKALTVIHEAAQNLAGAVLQTSGALSAAQLSAASRQGAQDFETTVMMLNSQLAGRPLFGGVQLAQLPLPDAETLLQDLELAVAGATTAEEVSARVSAWLSDPGGFSSHYQGGAPRNPLEISEGETAALQATALDPALRDTLSGMMKMALLDRGLFTGDQESRAELSLSAGRDLVGSAEARLQLAAGIGMTEQKLARAQSRNSAEKAALEITRNGITNADQYEAAIRLKDLEARLDAFYTLTARLSRLTLTDYLR